MADRIVCIKYDVNKYVSVFNDVCILLCKWNFRNVCSICIYTGNCYANFDGFTDPIIGWLIDHTNGRFGKFRPFLVVGNALLALSMILLYKTTHLVPEALQIPYFIVVYALYIIGYTVQGTVTTSAQTLLTNDPKQRPIYGFFTGFLCCSYRPEL